MVSTDQGDRGLILRTRAAFDRCGAAMLILRSRAAFDRCGGQDCTCFGYLLLKDYDPYVSLAVIFPLIEA